MIRQVQRADWEAVRDAAILAESARLKDPDGNVLYLNCLGFGQQRSKARRAPAQPQQPNARPQRMRRAGYRRNMSLLLQRRQDLERPQAAARYQNRVRFRLRFAHAYAKFQQTVLRHSVHVFHFLDAQAPSRQALRSPTL